MDFEKKYSEKADTSQTSPLERMEIQANIFPRFLLIPEIEGKKHAALLSSYGGEWNPANMQRMINDMAEYYGRPRRWQGHGSWTSAIWSNPDHNEKAAADVTLRRLVV